MTMTSRPTTLLSATVLAAAIWGCDGPAGQPMVTQTRTSYWRTPTGNGQEIDTEHYRIFTTATSRELLSHLPGFMEAAHRNYLALTGLPERAGAERMDIYMMGTRPEWAELTKSRLGAQAGMYLGIEAGGYCYDKVCVFWDMGGLGTFSTAAHEGLHQFFAHRMRDQLPAWLEEGLCAVAEGYEVTERNVTFTPDRNNPRFSNLRQVITQGRWHPLDKLLPMHAGDITGQVGERSVEYYGQLWALAQFIRSSPGYRGGLARLLADAEAGRLREAMKPSPGDVNRLGGVEYNRAMSEPLFRRYISDDLESFERQFRSFAVKLAKLP